MGLDTYASNTSGEVGLTEEQEKAFADEKIRLCWGMFSGGGSSFRGKVYHDVVMDITGVSIYEFWISPEKVEEMYQCFKALNESEIDHYADKHDHVVSEIIHLRKFLRVCYEHQLGLTGWW